MAGLPREETPEKVISVIDIIFPPHKKLGKAVISSKFGIRIPPPGGSTNHKGIDISYTNPPIPRDTIPYYSPVKGKVTEVQNFPYKKFTITDDKGYRHQFVHSNVRYIKVGDNVDVGTLLALAGGEGKRPPYATHIHYQILAPGSDQNFIDPVAFWAGQKQLMVPNFSDESNGVTFKDLVNANTPFAAQEKEENNGSIGGYHPRAAAILETNLSDEIVAILPNRVPEREPWSRTMLVNTMHINKPTDEVDYNTRFYDQFDPNSEEGKKYLNRIFGKWEVKRNPFWRR